VGLPRWHQYEQRHAYLVHQLQHLGVRQHLKLKGTTLARKAALKALPDPPEGPLGSFEGKVIEGVKIIVTRAGDGLSDAMPVAPHILHQDDEGYLVIKFKTTKIRFDPVKPGKDEYPYELGVDRVQILEATAATFVDDDLVAGVVAEMQERISVYQAEQKRKKDEAKGIFTFDAALAEDEGAEPD
jgi:uncharacterized small protein (DUF1192 family)